MCMLWASPSWILFILCLYCELVLNPCSSCCMFTMSQSLIHALHAISLLWACPSSMLLMLCLYCEEVFHPCSSCCVGDSPMQSLNSVLALSFLQAYADSVMLFNNQVWPETWHTSLIKSGHRLGNIFLNFKLLFTVLLLASWSIWSHSFVKLSLGSPVGEVNAIHRVWALGKSSPEFSFTLLQNMIEAAGRGEK
jgi:hypothetical protein